MLELEHPASLNVHNKNKRSALFLAAESNHPKIIEVHKISEGAAYLARLCVANYNQFLLLRKNIRLFPLDIDHFQIYKQ